jgi:hypothetical protein
MIRIFFLFCFTIALTNAASIPQWCAGRLRQQYGNLTSLEIAKVEGIKLAFSFVEMKPAIEAKIVNSYAEDQEKLNTWLAANNPSTALQVIVSNLTESEEMEVKTFNNDNNYLGIIAFFDAKIALLPADQQTDVQRFFQQQQQNCDSDS